MGFARSLEHELLNVGCFKSIEINRYDRVDTTQQRRRGVNDFIGFGSRARARNDGRVEVVGVGDEVSQHLCRCCVDPLQVVDHRHEWRVRRGLAGSLEHRLKESLSIPVIATPEIGLVCRGGPSTIPWRDRVRKGTRHFPKNLVRKRNEFIATSKRDRGSEVVHDPGNFTNESGLSDTGVAIDDDHLHRGVCHRLDAISQRLGASDERQRPGWNPAQIRSVGGDSCDAGDVVDRPTIAVLRIVRSVANALMASVVVGEKIGDFCCNH